MQLWAAWAVHLVCGQNGESTGGASTAWAGQTQKYCTLGRYKPHIPVQFFLRVFSRGPFAKAIRPMVTGVTYSMLIVSSMLDYSIREYKRFMVDIYFGFFVYRIGMKSESWLGLWLVER